ncbi:sensor histidine kinase [Peptoniphilus sp. HCN-40583]|uniref:sensor histidine kinase n=1 Tax=Peptoniphilus sp. HCN-40583 TaxID=3134662 RepID=UPI0030C13AAB
MNKKIRRFSFFMAFMIAFIFQIAASLDYHNRGIRSNVNRLDVLANRLIHTADESERLHLLKNRSVDKDDGIVYLSGEGKVLYTNSLSERTDALVDYAKQSSLKEQESAGWAVYSKGFLETQYIRTTVFEGGSMLIEVMAHDSMMASTFHYLPYGVIAAAAGGMALYLLLIYWMEREEEEGVFLIQNFRRYIRDPEYKMALSPLHKTYEEALKKEALRQRHQLESLTSRLTGLNDMVENMTEGVILVGEDRKIVSINEAAVKLLNASLYIHFQGKDLLYLCRERDFYDAFSRAFDNQKDDVQKIAMDGVVIKFFFDPIFNDAGAFYGMLILMIDETQQSLAERSRREFTSNVTHELKTPLTSISGYAELLRSGMVAEEDQEKFLDIILDESKKLFELIDAVISMSRLEEKNRPEEYRVVDMEALVKDVLKSYEPDAAQKAIHLGFQPGRDNRLYTHPDLMRELISNLVDNAIAYNVKGGNVRIVLDGDDASTFVVTIQDTGIGISYDDQRRIYERFYMADKSRSYNEKSTGLGLAIVKHNVDSLKGTIEVKSQLHHGSTFRLSFPKKGIYSAKS